MHFRIRGLVFMVGERAELQDRRREFQDPCLNFRIGGAFSRSGLAFQDQFQDGGRKFQSRGISLSLMRGLVGIYIVGMSFRIGNVDFRIGRRAWISRLRT